MQVVRKLKRGLWETTAASRTTRDSVQFVKNGTCRGNDKPGNLSPDIMVVIPPCSTHCSASSIQGKFRQARSSHRVETPRTSFFSFVARSSIKGSRRSVPTALFWGLRTGRLTCGRSARASFPSLRPTTYPASLPILSCIEGGNSRRKRKDGQLPNQQRQNQVNRRMETVGAGGLMRKFPWAAALNVGFSLRAWGHETTETITPRAMSQAMHCLRLVSSAKYAPEKKADARV